MKQKLMNKLGKTLGLLAFVGICAGYVMLPASCSLTPEQQQRLQSVAVPAAGILSKVAVSKGWVAPGDEIVIQRGVAVVTSPDNPETKLFQLAEIGLDHALKNGLIDKEDTIKVDSPTQVTITSPPAEVLQLPAPPPDQPPSSPLIPSP